MREPEILLGRIDQRLDPVLCMGKMKTIAEKRSS